MPLSPSDMMHRVIHFPTFALLFLYFLFVSLLLWWSVICILCSAVVRVVLTRVQRDGCVSCGELIIYFSLFVEGTGRVCPEF